MKLKELVNVKRGLLARAEERGEVRYLRIADFDPEGQLQSDNARFLSDPPDEKYLLQSGDILMSITASRFFAVEFTETEGQYAPNHFFNILKMKSDRYTAQDLIAYLNSDKVREQLDGLTEGDTIRTVPTKQLEDLRLRM